MRRFKDVVAWLGAMAFLACIFSATDASAATLTWQDVRSTVAIRGMASNGSLYVAAASNGIWTSTTLKSWTRAQLPANAGRLYSDVVWDGTQFVAVGWGILTSPDGMNWTVRVASNITSPNEPGNGDFWTAITLANGIYIAVGTDGSHVLRSADGHSWTSETTGLNPTGATDFYQMNGVASDGTTFVADAEYFGSSSFKDVIVTSPDGITWTQATLPSTNGGYTQSSGNGVAWGGGTFVVGGALGVYTSNDGVTWVANSLVVNAGTSSQVRPLLNRIEWINGQFLGVGYTLSSAGTQAATFESSDGVNWQIQDLEPRGDSDNGLEALWFDGTDYFAAGYLGVYKSADASTWTKIFTGPQSNLAECVIAGDGKLVIPGFDDMLISLDGKTWPDTLQPRSGSQVVGEQGGQGCGVYAKGAFYTVSGADGTLDRTSNGIDYSSVDATQAGLAAAVIWDGTELMAVDSDTVIGGAIYATSDGTNWSRLSVSGFAAPFNTYTLKFGSNGSGGLAFAGQRYFIWGSSGIGPFLYTSTDRVNWSTFPLALPSDTQINAVAFSQGIYSIVGSSSTTGTSLVYTSGDGINWKQVTGLPGGYHFLWHDMIADDNGFVAVGEATELGAAVMTSADGKTWSLQLLPEIAALDSVTTNGTQYVAVSNYDIVAADIPSSGGSGSSGDSGGGSSGGSSSGSGGGGGSLDILALTLLSGLALRRRERWMRD